MKKKLLILSMLMLTLGKGYAASVEDSENKNGEANPIVNSTFKHCKFLTQYEEIDTLLNKFENEIFSIIKTTTEESRKDAFEICYNSISELKTALTESNYFKFANQISTNSKHTSEIKTQHNNNYNKFNEKFKDLLSFYDDVFFSCYPDFFSNSN